MAFGKSASRTGAAVIKVPGVYVIADVTAKKAYVGSTCNLGRRLYDHNRNLERNCHANWQLQRAYNAGHQLRVTTIPVKEDVSVLDVEQKLLDKYIDTGLLYNISREVSAPTLGLKMSQETRDKVSAATKGRKHTPETIEKMKTASVGRNLGRVLSAEHRAKIGSSQIGKNISEEQKVKLREAAADRAQPIAIDGTLYSSISEAGRALEMNPGSIHRRIHSANYPNWEVVNK